KLRNLRVRGTGYGLGVRLSERSDLKEDNTYPEHNLTTTFCLELRQK
ncbi:MAG: hypothetical protein PWQ39_1577, partial [Thermacetogenium sp.]|nr:hypothetical protein [Thermacetogenium sp.]